MTAALLATRLQFVVLLITAALMLAACGRDPAVGHEPTSSRSASPSLNAATAGTASASRATPTSSVATSGAAPASGSSAPLKVNEWLTSPVFSSSKPVDVLIHGGMIVDGTGASGAIGDVVIDEGRIVHVGRTATNLSAKRRVDAAGMVVSPGFIDTHSHGDPANADHDILQGVTTICVGQDGFSAGGKRIAQWIAKLSGRHLRINAAPFVGHSTARSLTKVGLRKNPSDKQIARLTRFVQTEMKAGAWGLTTGLEYLPGGFAKQPELVAIAKPVGAADGVVMSHLRSEDEDTIDAAIDELLAQGRGSGARVHISHMKIVYGKGAARADKLLARMAKERRAGVRLTADIYPFNASYTTIGIVFPGFAKPPHSYAKVARRQRKKLANYLRERVNKRGGPEATLFGTPPYTGKTLAQLAAKAKKPFEEVLIGIGPRGASAAYFVMDEALQTRLLLDHWVMIGSDGSAGTNHPRGRATFAKLIRHFVVERKLLSIEEAIRKTTSLPAKTVGLYRYKRGLLRAGWAADVLVFDPTKIRDHATYEKPKRLATGMSWAFVNGKAAVAAGKLTRARTGWILLRK